MRTNRGGRGDDHFRFRFTGRQSDGRRLAILENFVPRMPRRLLPVGFPTVDIANAQTFDFLETRLPALYFNPVVRGSVFASVLPVVQSRTQPENFHRRIDDNIATIVSLNNDIDVDIPALISAFHLRTKTVRFFFPGTTAFSVAGDALQIGAAFSSIMRRFGSDALYVFCTAAFTPNPAVWPEESPQFEELQKIVEPFVVPIGFRVGFPDNPEFDKTKRVTPQNYPVRMSAGNATIGDNFVSAYSIDSLENESGNASAGWIHYGNGLRVRYTITHSNESLAQGRDIARNL
jgi:hypothetical protein